MVLVRITASLNVSFHVYRTNITKANVALLISKSFIYPMSPLHVQLLFRKFRKTALHGPEWEQFRTARPDLVHQLCQELLDMV